MPTPGPGRNRVPRWRMSTMPGTTSSPSERFAPRRFAWLSRPFRVLPAPFLCAISVLLRLRPGIVGEEIPIDMSPPLSLRDPEPRPLRPRPGYDVFDHQSSQVLAVALHPAVAHLRLVLEQDDVGGSWVGGDSCSHHCAGDCRLTDDALSFFSADQQYPLQLNRLANLGRKSIDLDDFARRDLILSPAGFDDRVHG